MTTENTDDTFHMMMMYNNNTSFISNLKDTYMIDTTDSWEAFDDLHIENMDASNIEEMLQDEMVWTDTAIKQASSYCKQTENSIITIADDKSTIIGQQLNGPDYNLTWNSSEKLQQQQQQQSNNILSKLARGTNERDNETIINDTIRLYRASKNADTGNDATGQYDTVTTLLGNDDENYEQLLDVTKTTENINDKCNGCKRDQAVQTEDMDDFSYYCNIAVMFYQNNNNNNNFRKNRSA